MQHEEHGAHVRGLPLAALFNTDLLARLFVHFLAFAVVGCIEVLLLNRFVSDAHTVTVVAAVFAPLTGALGFAYMKWVLCSMDGYTDGPDRYRRLCTRLESFAERAFVTTARFDMMPTHADPLVYVLPEEEALRDATHSRVGRSRGRRDEELGDGLPPGIDANAGSYPDSPTVVDASTLADFTERNMGALCDACACIVFYGFRLFRIDDTAILRDDHLHTPEVARLNRWIARRGDRFNEHDLDHVMRQFRQLMFGALRGLQTARAAGSHLRKHGGVYQTAAIGRSAASAMDAGGDCRTLPPLDPPGFTAVDDAMVDIDAAHAVPAPSAFRHFLTATIVVYFGVYVPLTLWSTGGAFVTVLVYPFIMTLLSGSYIFRSWLGDPFDPPPVMYIDFLGWRQSSVVYMRRLYRNASHC